MGSRLTIGIILTVVSVVVGILGLVFGVATPMDEEVDIILDNGDFQEVRLNEFFAYGDEELFSGDTYISIDSTGDNTIQFNLLIKDPSGDLILNTTRTTPYDEDVYLYAFAGGFEFRLIFLTSNTTMNDVDVEIYDTDINPLAGMVCCGAISLLSVAVILFIIGIALIISHFTGQEEADKKAKIRPASEIVDVNIGPTPPPQQQMRVVQQPMGYQGMPPQQGGVQQQYQQQYPPHGMPPQHPPRQANPPPQYGYGGVGPGG